MRVQLTVCQACLLSSFRIKDPFLPKLVGPAGRLRRARASLGFTVQYGVPYIRKGRWLMFNPTTYAKKALYRVSLTLCAENFHTGVVSGFRVTLTRALLSSVLSVERRESLSRGHASPRQGKVRSWEMERRIWRPRARRVARLARFQCGGRLTLPHPRPLPKGRRRSRPRFCTWGRQPPRPKSGRLASGAAWKSLRTQHSCRQS